METEPLAPEALACHDTDNCRLTRRAFLLTGTSLRGIRCKVRQIKKVYAQQHKGLSGKRLSYKVSSGLIKKYSIQAGILGGLTAAPGVLPGFGTAETLLLGLTADLIYLFRIQIKLCYGIAAAYDMPVDDEELQAITLALIGFSGTAEATKGLAASVFRNSIDRTAQHYLKLGVTKAAVFIGRKQGLKMGARAVRILPFLGIPICSSLNIAATMMVGNQARKYFSAWNQGTAPADRDVPTVSPEPVP